MPASSCADIPSDRQSRCGSETENNCENLPKTLTLASVIYAITNGATTKIRAYGCAQLLLLHLGVSRIYLIPTSTLQVPTSSFNRPSYQFIVGESVEMRTWITCATHAFSPQRPGVHFPFASYSQLTKLWQALWIGSIFFPL